MQTQLSHILFNIQPSNAPFYKDLLTFLGWETLYEDANILGVQDNNGTSLWFGSQTKAVNNDYDGPGMNHFAFGAASQADVDATAAYLTGRGVALLFETPRHRPEFAYDEAQTYYQAMFETPDRILIEVVYTGPKSE